MALHLVPVWSINQIINQSDTSLATQNQFHVPGQRYMLVSGRLVPKPHLLVLGLYNSRVEKSGPVLGHPIFATFPLLCIILNANRRTKWRKPRNESASEVLVLCKHYIEHATTCSFYTQWVLPLLASPFASITGCSGHNFLLHLGHMAILIICRTTNKKLNLSVLTWWYNDMLGTWLETIHLWTFLSSAWHLLQWWEDERFYCTNTSSWHREVKYV